MRRGAAIALLLAAGLAVGARGEPPPAPPGTLAFGTGAYVFAVRGDGSGGHALVRGDYPAFSRTGAALAFTLSGVWTATADGSRRRRIVPPFAEYIAYADPAWSPDARRLAYIRVDSVHETDELWVVDRNGRGLHGLASVHAARSPSWSADGRFIAYAGDGGLSEVQPDGSRRRLLVRGDVSSPAWSPDGSAIAFRRGGTIVLLALRTRRLHVLLRDAGGDGPLAWSPDGAWLAFATTRPGAGEELVRVRAIRIRDRLVRPIAQAFAQQLDALTWRR